jgi:hypothetical protein
MKQYGDQPLDLGEVFQMRHLVNDDKLLSHKYVVELEGSEETVDCIGCGRTFVSESYRNAHAQRAQHQAIIIADESGTQLKQPTPSVSPLASGSDRELEPVGAPAPTPVEATGVAADRGSRRDRTDKGNREVFRLS